MARSTNQSLGVESIRSQAQAKESREGSEGNIMGGGPSSQGTRKSFFLRHALARGSIWEVMSGEIR